MSYQQFLAAKAKSASRNDLHVPAGDLNPSLHEWQARIVAWAIEVGRAAIWADTGLGKTRMQLEWAWQHTIHSDRPALVIAPLAVCEQTVREAHTMGITDARYVRDQSEIQPGINVTNYERVPDFIPDFCAVVLDESSILKQSTGKTRTMLVEWASEVPARLACSATPAPNDPEELTNQAEWLGRMQRNHMLAAYFVHDQDGWRLKGHARGPMIEWMSSWAVAIRRPSDIGGNDDGYDLPGLRIESHLVEADIVPDGQLFATELGGVSGRAQVRKQTLAKRCELAAELVFSSNGWQSFGAKLATWDGSRSTPPTVSGSTSQTRPNGSAGSPSPEPQRRTANTCASTTPTTARSSSSTSETPRIGETHGGVNATRPIRRTAPNVCESQSSATPNLCETPDCVISSESPHMSTTNSSNSRVADAQSAAPTSSQTVDADSQLITATTPAGSAGSFAANATSDLASSETTQSCSVGRSSTYSGVEPWLLWVGLNDEQEYLAGIFGDLAFSVTGNMDAEDKADQMMRWVDGERPVLITKPSIASMGMNFQHCARMAFVGLSDSYEQYYQAMRRCYRYGQTRVVDAHIILSDLESQIATNVARKERQASEITTALIDHARKAHAA
ncbi:DNA helicase [Gordonia phage Squiddly]|nr:DNA helicase [Gordonia phage Squiddly]